MSWKKLAISGFITALAVRAPTMRPPKRSRILENTSLSRILSFSEGALPRHFFASLQAASKRNFFAPPSSFIFVWMPS